MSKTLEELDAKLTAIEQLEHMMKYCDYVIRSCEETGYVRIEYSRHTLTFMVDECFHYDNLASAIKKFAELTEH